MQNQVSSSVIKHESMRWGASGKIREVLIGANAEVNTVWTCPLLQNTNDARKGVFIRDQIVGVGAGLRLRERLDQ